jgi:acetolactate synthase-1/2/3 large subunit
VECGRETSGVGELAREGGRVLVDQLLLNGLDTIFCVPGESFLPVLDAIYDTPVRLVVCRQEGAPRTWPPPTGG